jgi:hypothetical protein
MPEDEVQQKKEEKSPEIQEAEIGVEQIFDSNRTGEERVTEIIQKIKPILKSGLFDEGGIIAEINQAEGIEDKKTFTAKIVSVLAPILELRTKDPDAFEKLSRAPAEERFTELNEVFSYNEIPNPEGKKSFLIHLPVDGEKRKRLGLMKIGRMFEQGMHELAKIAADSEDISKIEATSKLVKKYQRLMENLGFTVTGPIDEELRTAHFKETKPGEVWHAEIFKEDFLNKYLEEK